MWCYKDIYPFGMNVSGAMLEHELDLSPRPKRKRSGFGGVTKSFKDWWKTLK